MVPVLGGPEMFNPSSNQPLMSRIKFAALGVSYCATLATAGAVTLCVGRALFGLAVSNDPGGGPVK